MILTSLHLQNIRSYSDEKILFPTGSILLHGDIGAGKSTILQAIEFALFGIRRGQVLGSSLLRKGEKQARVELCFRIHENTPQEKTIVIERTIKKTATGILAGTGSLTIDDVTSDATPTELTAKIIEVLQYPQETTTKNNLIFRYSIYTPQAQMQQILFEHPDVRKDTIRKIFGIDKFHRIAQNAQLTLKHLKTKISEQSIRLEQKQALEEELRKTNARILSLKHIDDTALKSLEQQVLEEEKELHKIKEEYTRILQLKNIVEKVRSNRSDMLARKRLLAQEIHNLRATLDGLAVEKEDIELIHTPPPEQIEKELRELLKKQQEETLRKKDAQREYAHLSKEESHLRERIERMQVLIDQRAEMLEQLRKLRAKLSERNDVEKRIQTKRTLLHELLAKKEVLEKEIKKHEEQSAKVSQLTQCPTCYQEVKGEHKKKIEQLTKEHTTKLKEKLRELELACKDEERKLAKLLEQEKDFNQIEKEVRNIEELSRRRSEQMQEKHRLEEELSLIIHKKQQIALDEEENTKLSQAIARLEEQLEESKEMFKRKERLERITQQEKELSKREKTACIELSQIDEMLRKFDEQVEEYQQGIAKLTDLSLNLSKKQTKVNDLKKALMQLQQEKVRYETEKELLLEQKKNLENKLNDLDKIAQTTQELMEKRMFLEKNIIPLQQQLEELTLAKLQQQCSAHFSRWFNKLIESDEIEAHLDEAFSPRIISQGHEVDIEHLSGGEKTAVAFAYRLALNQLITSQLGDIHAKNLLILDEPTEGFSSEQLDRMRDVLDEVEANQIIIVSHEQKMESFCENIIHIEKTNGVSHAR